MAKIIEEAIEEARSVIVYKEPPAFIYDVANDPSYWYVFPLNSYKSVVWMFVVDPENYRRAACIWMAFNRIEVSYIECDYDVTEPDNFGHLDDPDKTKYQILRRLRVDEMSRKEIFKILPILDRQRKPGEKFIVGGGRFRHVTEWIDANVSE